MSGDDTLAFLLAMGLLLGLGRALGELAFRFKQAPVLGEIACHVSVLSAGCTPHAPHKHVEEEVLLILDGGAELVIPSGPDDSAPRIEPVQPGSFVYYPAFQLHTLRNPTQSPVTYLMFKWRSGVADMGEPLPARIFEYERAGLPPAARPMQPKPRGR